MRMSILAASLCLASLVPAAAQTAGEAPAPAPEKRTCRYYTTTGSIMPARRVCHTEQDWRTIDARNHDFTEHVIDPTRDDYQRIGPRSTSGG